VLANMGATSEVDLLASNKQSRAATRATAPVAYLILELLLLLLLEEQLLLVELLDGGGVNVSIEVRAVEYRRLGRFLDPEILWGLEVVPEN
jgi:hypothetical protein